MSDNGKFKKESRRNGLIFTEGILSTLHEWQVHDNFSMIHLENLSDLQDFFCRLLINNCVKPDPEIICKHLGNIICLKDDIKNFTIEPEEIK